MNTNNIVDIHCPDCGAPAYYDIRSGIYSCQFCGGKVTVDAAMEEKRGFRRLQQSRLQNSAANYQLLRASCSVCGAEVVFEENEAVANCAFCGHALVRKGYLHKKNMPEIVIPFQITLKEKTGDLKGFYLPYEFVRGPVSCKVRRFSDGGTYTCGGFIDEVFVNCSEQTDNLLLDGMEPYDINGLTGFDFSYVAGHRVKTDNISGKELERRVREEVSKSYAPTVQKVLETKAVEVDPDISSVVRMPALLPVYYLSDGDLMAAVNGQTGKVSVRAIKESYYFFLPWWLKSIFATIIISAIAFLGFSLFGIDSGDRLVLTAAFALLILTVTLVAYSDTKHMKFRIERGRKVFTSGNEALVRVDGELTGTLLAERNVTPPVFFEKLDGKNEEVVLRFSSPLRIFGMIMMALAVLFLPVIIALFLNGFNFSRLNLGGSAVWFCIFGPVIPIYLLKFGRIELYDRPWIYIVSPDGKMTRYRKKGSYTYSRKEIVQTILKILFIPPLCFAVWFGIACFCAMCYLTAFGW